MNRPLPEHVILPAVPPDVNLAGSPAFREWVVALMRFLRSLMVELRRRFDAIHEQINTGVQGVGADLDTDVAGWDGQLRITNAIHRVTGTGAIHTIVTPDQFSGPVFLVPVQAWTTTTSGNIALASTAVVARLLMLVYHPVVGKWFPTF